MAIQLVKQIVRKFEKDRLFVLEHYRRGYEKNMDDISKGPRDFKTVVREMLVDLEVADYCIKHFDFFIYNKVISTRKGK
ncbi:MAG: hypothetical protein COB44_01030 [Idiomarina sp.]|nr:MAG: hypothetical protein COB44_01030 [Idiomarina sp.]